MAEREYTFTFSDFQLVLKRRRRIIIATALILAFAMMLAAMASYALFESNGSIQIIASGGGALSSLTQFFSQAGASPETASEIAIIQSRTLAQVIIDRLGLSLEITDDTHGGPITRALLYVFADRLKRDLRSLRVDSVQFPVDSIDQKFYLVVTDDSSGFRVQGPSGDIGSGRAGDSFQSQQLNFHVISVKGPVGTKFRLEPRDPFVTMEDFNKQLTVGTVGVASRSDIISIVYKSNNPEKAADVVNAIIDEYEQRNKEWKLEQGSAQTDTIQQQLDKATQEMKDAEVSLAQYQSEHGVVGLPNEAQSVVSDLAKREGDRVDLNIRLSVLQDIQKNLAGQINSDIFSLPPSLTQDPVIAQLAGDQAGLTVELNDLRLQYKDEHPLVKAKKEQIVGVRENILQVLNATIAGLIEQRSNMDKAIAQADQKLFSIPGVEKELLQKSRTRDVADQAYRALMQQKAQAEQIEASYTVGNRIVDRAVPALRSSTPNIKRDGLTGLGLGLVLGLVLAFLLEAFDPILRKPEDIKSMLGTAPVEAVRLGTPEEISRAASALALAGMKNPSGALALLVPGRDSDTLRSQIEAVISNLSVSLQPLTLIDASLTMRERSFFGLPASPGLTEIAAGRDVQPHKAPDLPVLLLPGGASPSSGFVGSQLVQNQIQALKNKSALTIIYAPDQVSEPAMRGWAIVAGGAILVLKRDQELNNDVRQTIDALKSDNVPLLGALMVG